MAERFGGTGPSYWRNIPADEREYWLNILGIEGEVAALYEGVAPGDSVYFVEDMYDLDE